CRQRHGGFHVQDHVAEASTLALISVRDRRLEVLLQLREVGFRDFTFFVSVVLGGMALDVGRSRNFPDISLQALQHSTHRFVPLEVTPLVVARLPNSRAWMAAFRDPSGNVLELMSEVARS